MATDMNEGGWEEGGQQEVEADTAEGWGEAEQDVAPPMEVAPVSVVKLFNKW